MYIYLHKCSVHYTIAKMDSEKFYREGDIPLNDLVGTYLSNIICLYNSLKVYGSLEFGGSPHYSTNINIV